MSRLASQARKSLYLCYFPTPVDHDLTLWRRRMVRLLGPHVRAGQRAIAPGHGWFPPEGGRRRTWAWSSGEAHLALPAGQAGALSFDLGRPGAPEPAALLVEDEKGQELATATADPAGFARVSVQLPEREEDWLVRLVSPTFVPGQHDDRSLGVAVSRLRLTGTARGPRERVAERFPWLLRDPRDLSFLDSYDGVLANSEYTRGWIRRYWGVHSEVLFPPIRVHELHPGDKQRRIITVGRFFARGMGHSKKQLEMVQAFGDIVRHGGLDGWRLQVVGGVEPFQRPYFNQVRRAAEGLPVDLHPNAPRRLVEELLATSSVFWAATGLGEDESREPWVFEHFGMTTVEAMAAGCVPVVIDKAGQREIVRDGVDGFRWSTPDELEARTRELAGDDGLRERLAASACERAQAFSEDAFAERWRQIARKLQLR
jgi:glycosyltransferase involved in cell wall biosynthesis